MSNQLLDHNPDLKKLKNENFNISIESNHILIEGIPYLNSQKKILFGSIFCSYNLSGEKDVTQVDHTVYFTGESPCDQLGNELSLVNGPNKTTLTENIVSQYYLSSKPESGNYPDFYKKMKTYIVLLSAPAISIDPSVRPKNFDYVSYEQDSVFKYPDTNSARAEITSINNKLKDQKIAIIGLGGTGSFILDYISKTPVSKIALFDDDQLNNHNAYRVPGAVHSEELKKQESKISYLKNIYENLHKNIHCFEEIIDESNVNRLNEYDFVFIAVDNSKAKKVISKFLIEYQIPFIDVGMGIRNVNNSLTGIIRSTMITPDNMEHLNKISIGDEKEDPNNIYQQNIQIIELNALNAALAIIAWKKYLRFYNNLNIDYNSEFGI